jgi:hypothetical protein
MRHKDVMYSVATDLREYLESTDYANQITVDLYEIELSKLENDNRFNVRVGFYLGQENPNGSIPGTQFRGVRVDTGWPLSTVQVYNLQVSVRIADPSQNDEGNESAIIDVCDIINEWCNKFSARANSFTNCYISAFVWGGLNGVRRLGRISYTTATIYALRNTPNPNE